MSSEVDVYTPENQVRIVTATSLFDGHDAAINIMRRILQDTGAEVIHLGHNRSVQDIVDAAIEEDAHFEERKQRTDSTPVTANLRLDVQPEPDASQSRQVRTGRHPLLVRDIL